jgi:hypothetical protein
VVELSTAAMLKQGGEKGGVGVWRAVKRSRGSG